MQIIFALFFLLAFTNANAMGDPSIIYFFGAEILILFVCKIWVILCSRSWSVKKLALASLAIGSVLIVGLTFVPDYMDRRLFIDALSALFFFLSLGVAFYFLRFK